MAQDLKINVAKGLQLNVTQGFQLNVTQGLKLNVGQGLQLNVAQRARACAHARPGSRARAICWVHLARGALSNKPFETEFTGCYYGVNGNF